MHRILTKQQQRTPVAYIKHDHKYYKRHNKSQLIPKSMKMEEI